MTSSRIRPIWSCRGSPPDLGHISRLALIYNLINRQLLCKRCPKHVAIQFSLSGQKYVHYNQLQYLLWYLYYNTLIMLLDSITPPPSKPPLYRSSSGIHLRVSNYRPIHLFMINVIQHQTPVRNHMNFAITYSLICLGSGRVVSTHRSWFVNVVSWIVSNRLSVNPFKTK